ncbi:MAG TPA: TetR/AcrR family transcriptional regulator [Solirubrobacteraceae bacterium]|nr:TetR/AcrR family transcriptional regulator [Solirubrobacteraceae bacterium]
MASTPSIGKRAPAELPRGPHSLSREQVAGNQRQRLIAAMIEAVGEQGSARTTVAQVIARAGVSRKAFYQHFENKQACLLETYDELARDVVEYVTRAYLEHGEISASARAAIDAVFEWASEHSSALRLVLVEVGATGPAGIARREQLLGDFEEMLRLSLGLPPGPNPVLRAVVGGLNRVLYTCAQSGRYAELAGLAPALVQWATSYTPIPPAMLNLRRPAHAPASLVGGRAPGTLYPHISLTGRRGLLRGRGNVSHSLVVHSQRERILDAVANLATERGYAGLTCEAIAEEAAVSLHAFYTHFSGKEDAFLVAYEVGHHKSLAAVQQARDAQPDWQRGVRAGIGALFQFLASEPAFAHMALVDSLIATHRTADRAAKGADAYARTLAPDLRESALAERPAAVIMEAVAGGLFELCYSQALRGRVRVLPEMLPAATYFALAPFIGAERAARLATEPRG